MTDEQKLAERYVNRIPIFADEGEGFSRTQMQQSFLDGLEAGRQKWHNRLERPGVAMFEEEAKKYRIDLKSKFFLSEPQLDLACQGFKDGYKRANEWHYVKDGDLPKENQLVMVYRVNPLGANIAITNWYDSYKDTKVIAWKEIVPPKGSEINDCS